jgi:hypothetical protein
MTMMACRECGHPVSSEARACPSCGISRPTLPPDMQKAQAAASAAFNLGCLLLLGLFSLLVVGFLLALVL